MCLVFYGLRKFKFLIIKKKIGLIEYLLKFYGFYLLYYLKLFYRKLLEKDLCIRWFEIDWFMRKLDGGGKICVFDIYVLRVILYLNIWFYLFVFI